MNQLTKEPSMLDSLARNLKSLLVALFPAPVASRRELVLQMYKNSRAHAASICTPEEYEAFCFLSDARIAYALSSRGIPAPRTTSGVEKRRAMYMLRREVEMVDAGIWRNMYCTYSFDEWMKARERMGQLRKTWEVCGQVRLYDEVVGKILAEASPGRIPVDKIEDALNLAKHLYTTAR